MYGDRGGTLRSSLTRSCGTPVKHSPSHNSNQPRGEKEIRNIALAPKPIFFDDVKNATVKWKKRKARLSTEGNK